MYENFIKKIHQSDTVAIFMHINPDGDCIGSALALYAFLTNLGKTAHCFLEEGNAIKYNLHFLPFIEKINAAELKNYDLAVAVDCGSDGRLGNNCLARFLSCQSHIAIDHHETGEPFVEDMILEPKAASTTQILFKIFKAFDKSAIDKNVATLLFAGLMTDSGGLTFSSTTAECYQMAAELCAYGIDNYYINRKLFKENKLSVFNLTNRALSGMKLYLDNRVGVITFTQKDYEETGTNQEDTDGIINRVIDIIGVKVAISVSEINANAYKIGMRSKDGVDAGAIAKYFGGGGHFYASGCRIYGSYEEVLAKLIEAAGRILDGQRIYKS